MVCSVCQSYNNVVFAELLRTMTRQSAFASTYHCPKCFRLLHTHEIRSERSINALAKIPHNVKSARSKANWQRSEYRNKMAVAHVILSTSESFKQTCSKAIIKKFKDVDYATNIAAARKRYWKSPEYRQRRVLSTEQFTARSRAIHGDKYDYSLVNFDVVARNAKVKIVCRIHGVFEQRPFWHCIYGNGCPNCKTIISKPHQEIIDYIRSIYDGQMIINDRKIIGFELDIVLPDLKFAIEFNGNWYHSHYDSKHLSKYLHHIKASKSRRAGIDLFQIFEYDWKDFNKRTLILGMIANKIGKSQKIYAKSCILKELTNTEQTAFFKVNHLYGGKSATIAYSLYNSDDLVCVMSFQRHNKYWEIVRLATKAGFVVVGGASKLFKNFVKLQLPQIVKTYADRAISNGGVYIKLGFQFDGITKPGYKYFKNNRVYSRLKFQKHKLAKLLPKFDASKTELQNMFCNGYKAIWDAGHARYIWMNSEN